MYKGNSTSKPTQTIQSVESDRGWCQELTPWIRPYAESLFAFCRLRDPESGKLITQVVTTPEKPFADQIRDMMKDGRLVKSEAMPFPICAITFLDSFLDESRYNDSAYRTLQYSQDAKKVFQLKHPQPYDLLFQFDVRSKFSSEIWELIRQFALKLTRSAAYLEVDLGPLRGQFVRAEFQGPTDSSELTVPDPAGRSFKRTWSITFKGWLVPDVTTAPTMVDFSFQERDATDNTLYNEYLLKRNEILKLGE
jgi:hypothetical protein